jgi:hypothetical protein
VHDQDQKILELVRRFGISQIRSESAAYGGKEKKRKGDEPTAPFLVLSNVLTVD